MTVKLKPAKWDEFDEDCLNRAIWYIENPAPSVVKDTNLALWLKSLPGRFNLQPKQEWSEDDECNLKRIIRVLEDNDSDWKELSDWLKSLRPQPNSEWRHYIWATDLRFDFTALIKYDNTDNYEIVQAGNCPKQEKNGVYILIKDIKPQPSWKPSEEQMEALNALNLHGDLSYVGQQNQLISLYQDLKKLM